MWVKKYERYMKQRKEKRTIERETKKTGHRIMVVREKVNEKKEQNQRAKERDRMTTKTINPKRHHSA